MPVILDTLITLQIPPTLPFRRLGNPLPPRQPQILPHTGRIRKHRRRRAHFSAHVADRGHACCAQAGGAGTVVFDDVGGCAFNGQDGGEFENDVCQWTSSVRHNGSSQCRMLTFG